MTWTNQQRDDLKTELSAIDEAEAPISQLMKPLRDAIAGLEQMRDIVLLRYGLSERPEQCEGCECFILPGDKYCPTTDAGPLCETCSPTYGDMKSQMEERAKQDLDKDESESNMLLSRNIEAHLAGGGSLEDTHAPCTMGTP